MKLVHVEANHPETFGPVVFRPGLNVVFARVRDPAAKQRSSHNLGKSFLMDVLDFALGGDVDKDHPFKKRKDLFGDLEFTLQVQTNSGHFISVRRPIHGRAACGILIRSSKVAVGEYPDPTKWDYHDLSVADYRQMIDRLVDLADLSPYSFRKGLGYQMRGQADYDDEFQIRKFSGGKDREWRPFVARILGFDHNVFIKGYDIEDRIGSIKKTIKELEGSDQRNKQQYDEVRGLIEIREAEIKARRSELARFQFTGVEREVNRELVNETETRLAELNVRRYSIDRDLVDIDQSLAAAFEFDLDLVRRVYREACVELPGMLVREFEELAEFNRKISSDRNNRMARLRQEKLAERELIEAEIDDLDRRRQQALGALREAESFAKYRQLTDLVFGLEANLSGLRERLTVLSQAAALRTELADQQKALLDAKTHIEAEVQSENEFFREIRRIFNSAVHETVGARAVLSVGLNGMGHIEFKTSILDEVARGRETFEGEGTSYKKLLCACVDLALLQAHAGGSYYRFVYHDGIFEGLDNRRKVALLEYVRGVSAELGLQYIITVIDSDLPRNDRDHKLMFEPDEVILTLHDADQSGRLFRMERF
jgi:uncharacterized protein YydD (DUF2326 family)